MAIETWDTEILGKNPLNLETKTWQRKPWTMIRWASEKLLNLKKDEKKKIRSLDKETREKTSQPEKK